MLLYITSLNTQKLWVGLDWVGWTSAVLIILCVILKFVTKTLSSSKHDLLLFTEKLDLFNFVFLQTRAQSNNGDILPLYSHTPLAHIHCYQSHTILQFSPHWLAAQFLWSFELHFTFYAVTKQDLLQSTEKMWKRVLQQAITECISPLMRHIRALQSDQLVQSFYGSSNKMKPLHLISLCNSCCWVL